MPLTLPPGATAPEDRAKAPVTLLRKIWDRHVILQRGTMALLHVDRHIVHDGSFHAFRNLEARGSTVRAPELTFGTPDHYAPTHGRSVSDAPTPEIRRMLEIFDRNTSRHGVTTFGLGDMRQGIVHVVGPEQGITLPGLLLVCGDSHTSTHGALGAYAFGIGQSENEHVLATQCIWQTPPLTMRIRIDGTRQRGVTAKDVILAVIARIGTGAAAGHVIEYSGAAIRAMSMEERLTVCNMSIEAGARAGLVAPDDTTFEYLAGRPYAPHGALWDAALADWRSLPTDEGAVFDREVTLHADEVEPMVTWGTSPEHGVPIGATVPDPSSESDPARRASLERALRYMGLSPGTPMQGLPVDRVFIGSCTNSRIEDLRAVASVVRGARVGVPTLVVPGSEQIRAQAAAEGLDRVFLEAGMEWRHAGCSMCVGTNGDVGQAGQRIVSTSNRNFEGRQGQGVRTHLVSPVMAAAAALQGRLTDVRRMGVDLG
jgi:3-isopropylmalate/(R)-2-methylmalate dehydratase large subunit